MPIVPNLPISNLASANDHRTTTERVHKSLNNAVYSSDYTSLQDALDDALEKGKPLVIAPGTHTLTAPLATEDSNFLNVFAYGATLHATASMDAIVDLRGMGYVNWHGGRLTTASDVTVQNMLWVRRATDGSRSTLNTFRDLFIQGRYVTGIRIGDPGNEGNTQCDHVLLDNIALRGSWTPGETTLWQHGVILGDGTFGNNLNHRINHLNAGGNRTHLQIWSTNALVTGFYGDGAEQDLNVSSTSFSLRGGRCEESTRFMVTGGPATYAANIHISDVIWNAQDLAADGEWIQHYLAGHLALDNVRLVNPPAVSTPVIALSPGGDTSVTLVASVTGMVSPVAAASAFTLTRANVDYRQYIETGEGGAVDNISSGVLTP